MKMLRGACGFWFCVGSLVAGLVFLLPATADAGPRYYRSQRITIRLHKADIHHVLELFSDTFRFNMVISSQVKGRVSIFFRNVPWRQALYWILRSLRLSAVIDHGVYQISPLSERIQSYRR